jgi:glucose-6-phosphate 1-dehydrogenase
MPRHSSIDSVLRYVDGDYNDPATFQRLCAALAGAKHPLFYMAFT